MMSIRVLIADDHPVVQEGLRQVVAAEGDMAVVGLAGDGREALEKARTLAPDVILIDLNMPHMNGIEATRRIREACPKIRIVAFSMHSKEAYVRQAFTAGATGFVLKGAPVEEVLRAIHHVHEGEYFLCSQLKNEAFQVFLHPGEEKNGEEKYDLLSEREQQVFRLIVEGHSTGQIGNQLCVSPKTVEKHRVNIMRKLKIHNLVDLVKYAIRVGIIDPDLWR